MNLSIAVKQISECGLTVGSSRERQTSHNNDIGTTQWMVVQILHKHMQAYTHTYTPLTSKVIDILHLMARMVRRVLCCLTQQTVQVRSQPQVLGKLNIGGNPCKHSPHAGLWRITDRQCADGFMILWTPQFWYTIQYGESQSPLHNIDRGQCLCLNTHSVSDACKKRRKRWGSNLQ